MGSELAGLTKTIDGFSRRVQAMSTSESFPNLESAIRELGELADLLQAKCGTQDREQFCVSIRGLQEVLIRRRCEMAVPDETVQASSLIRDLRCLLARVTLAAGLATVVVMPALAQDATAPSYIGMTPQDVGVLDRPRPEYDAKGIPMGGFRMFPTMDVTANWDDNVFRQPTGVSDWYFEETPEVRIESQWGRHFLEFYGGADNYNYSSYSRLNLTDWTAGIDGRYDISRSANMTASAYYGEYHESLESPNTVGFQAEPNRYNKGHGDVTAVYQPNRLGFGVGGSIDRYDWKNTSIIGGGGTLFNSDRNETEYQAYAKTFYDFSPGYSVFVKGLYDDRHFDHFLDRSGLHRSSYGYRLDAGVDMQITHLLSGEVYLGYLDQRYSKNVPTPLPSISGLDYGANLNWYASDRLTMHLTGARTVSDVTLAGVSATEDASVKLSADYEFRYNVIVQAYGGYTQSRFIGTSPTRTDDYPVAGVTVKYLMNRYMSLEAGYHYDNRNSNYTGLNFSDDTVSVGLSLHI